MEQSFKIGDGLLQGHCDNVLDIQIRSRLSEIRTEILTSALDITGQTS
jgi:hypothetical protein